MKKRGQFFILTAVIMISILSGFSLYTNKIISTDDSTDIDFIARELKEEGNLVIDQGIMSGTENLEEFVEQVSENLRKRIPSLEMIFIYRVGENLKVLNLAKEDVNLTVGSNNKTISLGTNSTYLLENFENPENLTFYVGNIKYESKWIYSNKFYFWLRQTKGDKIEVRDVN